MKAKGAKIRISVIIPTLNEEKGIDLVLKRLPKEVDEVIIVDGCSTDKTVDIVKKYGARVIMEKRKGYGRAYKTGFQYAKGEIIATLDGDGSYDPGDIIKLVKVLKSKKVDFVSGNRLKGLRRGSMSFPVLLGNLILSIIFNFLFGVHVYDSQSGMWVFRKSFLKKINLKEDGMAFSSEIKLEAWKKGKFVEYPISYAKRLGKKKTNPFKQGFEILRYLVRRRFLG